MSAARLRIGIRLGARRSTLPPFYALSLVAHVGLAAAILLLPNLRPAPAFPMEPAIQAVLLPAPAPGRSEPPPPAAPAVEPEPEPEPVAEEVTAAPDDPPAPDPDPPPAPKPEPRQTEPPKPRPKATPPPAPPSGPSRPTSGSGSSSGPVGNPDGGDALAGMGAEFNWYRDAVARALYSAWRQPVLNAAEPVEVAVAFEIVRSGAVRNVRLDRESGLSAVDRSVLRAVHDASLPPLPRNYGRAAQPALFVFRLYPE